MRVSRIGEGDRFFQRKVSYDNLPVEVLGKLRRMTRAKAQRLLESMNQWLSEHDRDLTPLVEGTGRKRAGVGIYYFEEDVLDEGKSS